MTNPAPIKPPHLLPLDAFDLTENTVMALICNSCRFYILDLFAVRIQPDAFRQKALEMLEPEEIEDAIVELEGVIRAYGLIDRQGAWAAPESESANEA